MHAAPVDRRSARHRSELARCSAIGALGAIGVLLLAPPAQDLSAHVYRATLVAQGGVLWDNYWYTGDYPLVSYSVLAPVLAALTGLTLLLICATACSGALFARIALREWGEVAVWPARAFAIASALPLIPGVEAYAVAVPFVLGTFVAMQSRRPLIALVCAALALAASPLAFVFLLVIAAAVVLAGRCGLRALLLVGSGLLGLASAEALIAVLVFPAVGVYPFLIWHLAAVSVLATGGMAVAYRDRATRPIALLFGGWGIVCLGSYLVSNPIGDNLARLRYAAFPLLLLVALRQGRRLAPILALAALIYATAPDLLQATEQADAKSSHARVWEPVVHYLRAHLSVGERAEVVPTSARWEAYYLPSRGVPLARGWFRQTDMARNRLFYRARLPATTFGRWLRRDAVEYVVLTPFPPDDHGARTEAALLRSGRSGLRVAWRHGGFTVFETRRRARLVAGPVAVQLTRFSHEQIAGASGGRGVDALRVWFSPYWIARGAARCVTRAPDGMSLIRLDHPGPFSITISHDPLTIVARVADPDCRPG